MKNTKHIPYLISLLGRLTGILLLFLVMLPVANAEYYDIRIKKVAPKSVTGDVVIQFKPGSKETGFSGKARGVLMGGDPATNRALAIILTAISLGSEITILVESPPSYDVIQTITSTTLIAP